MIPNKLHLTINPFSDTALTTSVWTIGKSEPERISARYKNQEYTIVLGETPTFEVWSVDNGGELLELEQRFSPNEEIKDLLESVGIRG